MNDDTNGDFESRRTRRTANTRTGTPRATRTTRHNKKKIVGSGGVAGVHRRRNKHWSW